MYVKTCAPFDASLKAGRFRFDTAKLQENVRKLQMRIVKAQQSRRYNKVKALQWILTHSLSAKILAVRRVTENKGKKTSGIDEVIWTTDRQKCEAVNGLKRAGYTAQPLKRVYIPKKNGKQRPLGIPTMMDRAQQALHLMALDPIAETILDNDTYGFRAKRSTADAIEAIFKAVFADKDCAQWVIEGDIKACFDNISHEWLLKNIPMDKKILGQWLKAGIVFKEEFSDTYAGTPQGGIISPCLANLALNGLGSMLERRFKSKWIKRKEIKSKVHTIVYADDFIITGRSREFLEGEVLTEITGFMEKRGLSLSEEKTVITHIDDGFDFLGQNIRKYKGKVLVKPAKENVSRFLKNIKGIINKNLTTKQEELIDKLNPKIRGWTNYHRHIVAKETFSYVDFRIYHMLQRWCKRRHQKKGKWWINKKYFHRIGNRNWVFAVKSDNGEYKELIRADATKIIRHTKIRKEANPYDPEWDVYFEEREGNRMFQSMTGRERLKEMWREQGRKCPACGDEINKDSGWKVHIDAQGKKNLIHPYCHKVIHLQNINAVPAEMRQH